MANPGYLRSTDGDDADNGSTWALANATAVGAMADASAGDRIWVSQAHDETTATAIVITMPGTIASPCQFYCGNDAAEPPTSLATTGIIKTTGGANARNITLTGSGYLYGLTFAPCYGTANYGIIYLNYLNANGVNAQILESCTFQLPPVSNSNAYVDIGYSGNQATALTTNLINCTTNFGGASQGGIRLHGNILISGMTIGGTLPTGGIFVPQNTNHRGLSVLIENCDLSGIGSGYSLVNVSSMSTGQLTIRNCKLGASVTLVTGTHFTAGSKVKFHNCSSGDQNYILHESSRAGTVDTDTATYVTSGGAGASSSLYNSTSELTALSWKMVSDTDAEFPLLPLESPEIVVWNDTVGSEITLTVEYLHDTNAAAGQGAGTGSAFRNDELWIECSYLNTSGFPKGASSSSRCGLIATPSDNADGAGTGTWTNSMTTPKSGKLTRAITCQERGFIHVNVMLAKAGKTIYINPKVTIT